MAQVVKILIAAAVLFTYGLQYFVPLEIIWNSMKHMFSHKYAAIGETAMRIVMVMVTGNEMKTPIQIRQRSYSPILHRRIDLNFIRVSDRSSRRLDPNRQRITINVRGPTDTIRV